MNLLFDLDGTLTDPFLGITQSIVYSLEKMGRTSPPNEQLGWCIGPPLKKSFAVLLNSDSEPLADEALSHYRERYGTVGMFENNVYDGIPEELEEMQERGHILYVATSKPWVYARPIIAHFGLDRYFKQIFGSELDGTRNDKVDLISHILEVEAIPSFDARMIGDREHDIKGAKANMVESVGVLWGYGSRKELEASGATWCIEKPRELSHVIE